MCIEHKVYRPLEKREKEAAGGTALSNSEAGAVWGNEFSHLITNLTLSPKYVLLTVSVTKD